MICEPRDFNPLYNIYVRACTCTYIYSMLLIVCSVRVWGPCLLDVEGAGNVEDVGQQEDGAFPTLEQVLSTEEEEEHQSKAEHGKVVEDEG